MLTGLAIRKSILGGPGVLAAGGAAAWAFGAAGLPWAGLGALAAGVGLGGWLCLSGGRAAPVAGLREFLAEAEALADHPYAAAARDIRRLLTQVEGSGRSIRDVVRHLQEHATLVAWVIDTLNETVSGARKSLVSMQEAMGQVAEHAGEVLAASQKGSDFIGAMGERTEDLFRGTEVLNRAVEEATASVSQIHGALSTVEQGVELLSEASDRTTQFIAQVGGAMGSIRARTDQNLAMAQKVEEHARQGRETVVRVGKGVREIRRASEDMVQAVHALSRQSKEIEGILGIITDVAEETSLLSLNAAILAAQAGERGAAFAVVADQIRSLARRTRDSTKHIEDLVRGIQSNIAQANLGLAKNLEAVEEGDGLGQEAVRQLGLIEDAVAESVEVVREIARAAQDQDEKARAMVDAAGEVNSNLHQVATNLGQSSQEMDRIQALIQSLSALSESVRSASEEHRDTGRKTRELMGSLSTQVEGIHGVVDRQSQTATTLDQSLGQVSESSDSTRESLEMIHSIVSDLVKESDRLQEEVQGLSAAPGDEPVADG